MFSDKVSEFEVKLSGRILAWYRVDLCPKIEVFFQELFEFQDFGCNIQIIFGPVEQQRIHGVVLCVSRPVIPGDLIEIVDDCLLFRHLNGKLASKNTISHYGCQKIDDLDGGSYLGSPGWAHLHHASPAELNMQVAAPDLYEHERRAKSASPS